MIYINARFLSQKITGVQRFAVEVSRELKKIYGEEVILLAPHNVIYPDIVKELGVRIIGKRTGYGWEQMELPEYLKEKGRPLLLNLCNLGPLNYPNSAVVVHDIAWKRFPESYSAAFVRTYRFLLPKLCRRANHVFTVSEFSKKEICTEFSLPQDKVSVVYSAVTSVFRHVEDEALRGENYILTVSSMKANKNFGFVVKNFDRIAARVPGLKLYIIGDLESKSFSKVNLKELRSNPSVRLLGRVSDEDLVRYYSNARAFVFPSLFEGFGLPVLEAQACGCPVVSSNTSSLPEVLGDSAVFFDPLNDDDFVEKVVSSLDKPLKSKAAANLARFSWKNTAASMSTVLDRLEGKAFKTFLFGMLRYGLGLSDSVGVETDDVALYLKSHQKKLTGYFKYQGIPAIMYDAMDKLVQNGMQLDAETKLAYMNPAIKSEKSYRKMAMAISSLASKFSDAGIRTMLLKGLGVSLYYPVPNHRPSGDMDIWLFGRQTDGDEIVRREGIKVSYALEHHSIFSYMGIEVENHSEFFNVASIKSNGHFHSILVKAADESEPYDLPDGTRIYLPSPAFNAIFLLRHMGTHFAPMEMRLRQVLDWGFFVKACGSRLDWNSLMKFYKEENLYVFFTIINAICFDYLGFDRKLFPDCPYDRELEERVLREILHPEFNEKRPASLIRLLPWKWRRWRANLWKHRLVYKDTPLMVFFTQMTSHIMKPKSFRM